MSVSPQPSPTISITAIEFGATLIACLLAFAWPRLGDRRFARIERVCAELAHRKWLAVGCIGLSVIVLRLAILPLLLVPIPFDPDDFSTLLAADTFAHGRLTNPTPAMWTHFESIHITMQPTYQSMYFPGQGLLLAAARVILGNPWIGQLLVSALMCAALCWMLQAWLPANWALLGGLIAVVRLGVFSYWTNTYHAAGSLAALAGALILGGLPRLMRTARLRYALSIGVGVSLLILSRPYEGLLLCIPVGFVLVHWMWKGKNRPKAATMARLAVAPLALVVATGTWLGYYDYKAFGSPLTLPYSVNRAQYAMVPYYIWQHPRPEPAYRHAAMRSFYEKEEMGFYLLIHSIKGFVPYTLGKAGFTLLFYSGIALLVPLIMARRVVLDRRIRLLVVCVLVLAGGLMIEIFVLPHYVAPSTAAFYAIGLQAMRHLRLWKPEGKPVGLAMVRSVVTLCVLLAGVRLFAKPLHMAPQEWPPSSWLFTWYGPEHFGMERAQIEAQLEKLPGGQLAIVRYGSDHNPLDEWVYNGADIDGSKVVWAREMDAADNVELTQYYRDRRVWLVEPDAIPARISPYPIPETK
jgi:hypothetical protein